MGFYGDSAERWLIEKSDSPRETIPRARLAKLPSVTVTVLVMALHAALALFYIVIAIFDTNVFAVIAAVFFTIAFMYRRRIYRSTINRRNELRESNFWAAMDFVIETEPPERSPQLAELERPYDALTLEPKPNKASKRRARRKANSERYQQVLAIYRRHHHCEQEPCRHKPDSDYLKQQMGQPPQSAYAQQVTTARFPIV